MIYEQTLKRHLYLVDKINTELENDELFELYAKKKRELIILEDKMCKTI